MSAQASGSQEPRLVVKAVQSVEEELSRGNLQVRRIFTEETLPFESSLSFVLYNRIPAGGRNEPHTHDDVEKVYHFLRGSGEVRCGPWSSPVSAGDFLFFPAAIEHEIRCGPTEDLEFIVCAARTLAPARGLEGVE